MRRRGYSFCVTGDSARDTTADLSALASRALRAGALAAAEQFARAELLVRPTNAVAWYVLGRVAQEVGLIDAARAYFERTASADASLTPAHEALAAIRACPSPQTEPGERFLLIREWGAGFFSDVDHVLGQCLAAEISGRRPVVYWGERSLFRRPSDANAWDHFFEPVSDATMDMVRAAWSGGVYPPRWESRPPEGSTADRWASPETRTHAVLTLARPEPVVISDFHTQPWLILAWAPSGHRLRGAGIVSAYRDLAARYLRPKPHLVKQADGFYAEHLRDGPSLAIHLRGTDKVSEAAEVDNLNRGVLRAAWFETQRDPRLRVYVLTDSEPIASMARDILPVTVLRTVVRGSSKRGVHYERKADPVQLGEEVLIDALVATRCDRFIGLGWSNVSAMVSFMRRQAPETSTLLGMAFFTQPNWDATLLGVPDPTFGLHAASGLHEVRRGGPTLGPRPSA